MSVAKSRIVGIDGCPAGWIAAIAPTDKLSDVQIRVFAHFGDIVEQGPFARIAVDMPIGLPELGAATRFFSSAFYWATHPIARA